MRRVRARWLCPCLAAAWLNAAVSIQLADGEAKVDKSSHRSSRRLQLDAPHVRRAGAATNMDGIARLPHHIEVHGLLKRTLPRDIVGRAPLMYKNSNRRLQPSAQENHATQLSIDADGIVNFAVDQANSRAMNHTRMADGSEVDGRSTPWLRHGGAEDPPASDSVQVNANGEILSASGANLLEIDGVAGTLERNRSSESNVSHVMEANHTSESPHSSSAHTSHVKQADHPDCDECRKCKKEILHISKTLTICSGLAMGANSSVKANTGLQPHAKVVSGDGSKFTVNIYAGADPRNATTRETLVSTTPSSCYLGNHAVEVTQGMQGMTACVVVRCVNEEGPCHIDYRVDWEKVDVVEVSVTPGQEAATSWIDLIVWPGLVVATIVLLLNNLRMYCSNDDGKAGRQQAQQPPGMQQPGHPSGFEQPPYEEQQDPGYPYAVQTW